MSCYPSKFIRLSTVSNYLYYYIYILYYIANEDVLKAANILCDCYTQSRYIPPDDDWPPYHPKHYTPLTIVHHEGRCTEPEIIATAQKFRTAVTTEVNTNDSHRATESINSLVAPFEQGTPNPYMILIEGAPGVGKTILSKEIAFQWAKKIILKNKTLLFLVYLRNPQIKSVTDIQSFVKCFCQRESLTNKITDWLIETGGKYLTIVFDGYDEMSKENKNCFIVDSIIGRQKIPNCGIIITSRPAATAHLHDIVDCRAEVLGFTEEDRQSFIHDALVGHSDKIEELAHFLMSNPFLNALCYIPLNMSILLCLTKEGINILPKTQTNLYQKFIIITIVHFLKKDDIKFNTTITSLDNLPHPYDQVAKELSQFAFLAVQKDQLVFTLAEVNAECPNLTPANWYGLGLLKRAQYFKAQDGCDHESFHFLHYSIQEYMAAYYIASLPDNELLTLLKETFWNVNYLNTWVMYVGITGGKHFIFAHFLSENRLQVSSWLSTPRLSNRIFADKIKCLHLLHCSAEAGYGNNTILSSVKEELEEGIIDLSNYNLSINDLRTLAVLLLRSPNKHWEKLNLSNCNIDDNGCNLLCEVFQSHNVVFKIKTVDISYNGIQWESLIRFCEILKLWPTEKLIMSTDTLYDKMTMKEINSFTNKLHRSISTYFTAKLFSGMLLCTYMPQHQKMLAVYSEPDHIQCFELSECNLNDALIVNLNILIVQKIGIERVNTIAFSYNISCDNASIKSTILSYYVSKVTFCGSNMHSKGVYLMKIPFTVQQEYQQSHNTAADYLAAVLCHNTQLNSSYLKAIPTTLAITIRNVLPTLVNLKTFNAINNEISEEGADDIATLLLHNNRLQELYLGRNNLQTIGTIKVVNILRNVSNLTVFSIPNNNISEEAADDIATILSHNAKLQKLQLGGNNLQSLGAIKIMKGLQKVLTLTKLGMSNNNICEEAAGDIAAVLSHNTKLQELYLGGNNLQSSGIMKIAKGLHNISKLTIFSIPKNNIGKEAASDIAAVLSHNTKLQRFELGGNNLQSSGAAMIAKGLQNSTNLTKFGISKNDISEEAADYVAMVLSHNTKLQELYLGENNLQSTGTVKIAKGLHNLQHLTIFYIYNNNISEEAADYIATILSYNSKLQELHLGKNNLQSEGAIKIANGLQNVFDLTTLGISYNNIGEEAADDIAVLLSHNTRLQKLYLNGNNLQSMGAIKIANGLQNNSNLTVLSISDNNIGEEAADDIAAVLAHNTDLQELYLGGNNLQSTGAAKIVKGLRGISNLKIFSIYDNNIGKEAADDIAFVLSRNTKLQKLDLGGNNLQSAGAVKIARSLQNVSNLTIFYISNNNISEEAADDIATVLYHNTKLQKLELGGNNLQSGGAIKITKGLCNVSNLKIFSISNNQISEEAADSIATVLSHNTHLQELYLGGNNLQSMGAIKIAKGLQNISNITIFSIYNNNLGEETVDDIMTVLSQSAELQKLDLSGNNLQTTGAIKVAKGLQKISNLKLFYISNNHINEEAADEIATALSHNTKLQELDLGGNNLQSEGAIKIAKSLQNVSNLTKFGISNNSISEDAVDDVVAVLSHNTKLQELYLVGNNLQSQGAIKIAKGLQNLSNLTIFSISNNNVSKQAADDIAIVLSHNIKLKELYLGGNNLQSAGAIKITNALYNVSDLIIFDFSNNNINEEAADDIAAVLSHNIKLKELYLGGNNLQSAGAIKIVNGLHDINLTIFNISNNNISKEAADDIAAVLHHGTDVIQM